MDRIREWHGESEARGYMKFNFTIVHLKVPTDVLLARRQQRNSWWDQHAGDKRLQQIDERIEQALIRQISQTGFQGEVRCQVRPAAPTPQSPRPRASARSSSD